MQNDPAASIDLWKRINKGKTRMAVVIDRVESLRASVRGVAAAA